MTPINKMISKHHEILSLLRDAQVLESDIINCEEQLKVVGNPLIDSNILWYIETIATSKKKIEVILDSYETLINKLT